MTTCRLAPAVVRSIRAVFWPLACWAVLLLLCSKTRRFGVVLCCRLSLRLLAKRAMVQKCQGCEVDPQAVLKNTRVSRLRGAVESCRITRMSYAR